MDCACNECSQHPQAMVMFWCPDGDVLVSSGRDLNGYWHVAQNTSVLQCLVLFSGNELAEVARFGACR